ncbi:MAG: hypothetical protein HPY69_13420 [Armatimonadetes bacterium]|nr:hypothetical protein [Armatimonadota bacterium]
MTSRLAMTAMVVGLVSLAGAEEPRVALLHGSYGNFRHRDDYDGAMQQLGWTLDKFENKNFTALAGRLDDYDILLGTALFNYAQNVQDFSVYREELTAFMARGGALVLTDCNYPDHVGWLAKWGPDWAVGLASCGREGTANKWLDRRHPIFCSAAPTTGLPGSWTHMVPGEGWEVLARCADDGATALFRPMGRGFILLTSFWPHGVPQLRNLWGTLQYTRAGVLPLLPDVAGFTLGHNEARATFRNLTDAPLPVALVIEVLHPGGQQQTLTTEATVPSLQTAQVTTDVPLPHRGSYRFSVSVRAGDKALPAAQSTVTIPEMVEVELVEPRYRGCVMLAAPPSRVKAEVVLHPFNRSLEGATYTARLLEGRRIIAETAVRPVERESFTVSLPLRDLRGEDLVLEVTLTDGFGDVMGMARRPIPVIPQRPNQVFVDEDLNTRVDGKLFFPICIYHVPAQDYGRVRSLGFNSVQAWGTTLGDARANLDAAREAGLKVVLEGVTYAANNGDFAAMNPTLDMGRDHPALLAWYITDEPSGDERLRWCAQANEYIAARDPHHPTYLVSCSPGEFRRYVWVTDIFAVDPYPIPAAPVTMVSSWMEMAQEAARGRKPVWLIPQLHNWEAYGGHPERGRYPTPAEERNMVYQGLVWGAKAIFYYPWEDGPTGLTHDAELMEAVKAINGELAVLGPELLTCEHEVTARNRGEAEGLFAALYRGDEASYVIAVSVAQAEAHHSVPAPGLGDGQAEVLFEGRSASVQGGTISDQFAPLGVHVYRVSH